MTMSDLNNQWGPTLKRAADGATVYYAATRDLLELEFAQEITPEGWKVGGFKAVAADFLGDVRDFLEELVYRGYAGPLHEVGLRYRSIPKNVAEAGFWMASGRLTVRFTASLKFAPTSVSSEIRTMADILQVLRKKTKDFGWKIGRI
jgi:hypothetical protein